jgi:hypothetical protein
LELNWHALNPVLSISYASEYAVPKPECDAARAPEMMQMTRLMTADTRVNRIMIANIIYYLL